MNRVDSKPTGKTNVDWLWFHYVDLSDIFRTHSADLCKAIEAGPLRIANELNADNLIAPNILSDVRSMSGNNFDKADKIVGEMDRQLNANSDPVEFLNKICELLQQQTDSTLKDIGIKMMSRLNCQWL